MIELRNVEKTYHTASGDIHALKRTSLTIEQGRYPRLKADEPDD